MTTRIGSIILKVPKHRDGEAFKTYVFDNYCRSGAALIITMAEMVVNGVSTRKVSQVMETLCGKSFSKSTVSEACKELDEKVGEFRKRPPSGEHPFLTIDATYFSVREKSRVTSKAFIIAYATNTKGTVKSSDYKDIAENAITCLDEGFEAAITVMVLPRYLHKYFRTSNQIERLNKELKQRSKVIGVFPNAESLMRLMGAVLLERNEVISTVRCMFNAKTC